jgi:hypothetical protein
VPQGNRSDMDLVDSMKPEILMTGFPARDRCFGCSIALGVVHLQQRTLLYIYPIYRILGQIDIVCRCSDLISAKTYESTSDIAVEMWELLFIDSLSCPRCALGARLFFRIEERNSPAIANAFILAQIYPSEACEL